ncbi:MAG TPA: transglutaminaseTgpA domain-containing protein, partial [Solirubrobacteraceae bacterium]|nr:transglutaminaseTgpA domain-containing protein [Solirubrobacteraceae bacterium]
MSAWAEGRAEPSAVRLASSDEALGPVWVRLVVFFAVTTLSALAYERLLHDPPAGVAFAVAGAATVCGVVLTFGLAAVERVRPAERSTRWVRAARAAIAVVAALVGIELGLLAVGVPVHLLAPWRWGALASAIEAGLGQLGAWNWPYLGSSHWARTAVLMLLVPATTVMALLFFWPARAGGPGRRLGGLAIAVGLALCGMTNSPGDGWRVEGLLLVPVVFAWLWLPTMRRPDAGRALRWTVACTAGALILAPVVSGSHSWISFAANEGANPTEFQWDQLYGPGGGPHSHDPTLLNVRATAAPGLLRVTSLDRFDGLRFIRSDSPPDTAATDIPPSAESRSYQTATITIAGLRSSLLVGASGITTHVDWQGRRAPSVQRNPDGTLSLGAPLVPGSSYTVTSYAPKPTPAQMAAAPAGFPASYVPYTELELPRPSASALETPQLEREASSPPQQSQLVRAPAGAARILASPYGPAYSLARHLAAGA